MNRKVLKEVQGSCLNKISNPIKMSVVADDEIQKLSVPVDEKDQSKENVGAVRRSKRKNVGSEVKTKKTSKEVTKKAGPKKVAAKKSKGVKKVICEALSSSCLTSDEQQKNDIDKWDLTTTSKIMKDSSIEVTPSSSITSDEVNFLGMHSVLLNKSVTDDISLMTSVKPSEKYWEMLAEERRIALEKTLYENECLHDQLVVLETEIRQLRNAMDAAERVFKTVGLLD